MPNHRHGDDLFGNAIVPVAPLGDSERIACLRLIRTDNVGPVAFQTLTNQFGGAELALAALPELSRRGGRKRALRICSRACAERELAAAHKIGATPLFTIEPGYPAALAAVDHPPPMLYTKGDVDQLNRIAIAIVGSRKCSAAGTAFARQLASDLGRHGITIVSGLARGIDGAAHRAALSSGTIAVLAGGIDSIYPPEHRDLHQEIAASGCLVSECPPGFQPRGQDFPRRNRIISGLSRGVVIVEAARKSGSLTTARLAGEQGRDVFAVPGHPLDPRAYGTNKLIKDGAILVTNAEDIVGELAPAVVPAAAKAQTDSTSQFRTVSAPSATPGDAVRHDVINCLGPAPVTVDDICRTTQLAARDVQMVILELSLAGRIEHHGHHLISLVG
ncbi:MAG: DNA-processing protein DprA [Hyphomicrobiaceae bacterium]